MLAEDIGDVLAGRPPRHREGWTPSTKGERTIASAGPAGSLATLDLVQERTPSRPRRSWRRRLAGLAFVAAVAAAAHHFTIHPEDVRYWRRIGREARGLWSELTTLARAEPPATPSPPPAATASGALAPPLPEEPRPASSAEQAVDGSAGLPVETTLGGAPPSEESDRADAATSGSPLVEPSPPEPSPPEAAAAEPAVAVTAPTPRPEPAATPSPSPKPARPSPKPSARRKAPPSAYLSIGFEHDKESGTLEVWVDGKRVVKEALDSRVTRKLLLLELRQGSVQQTLSLAPGRHEVRVRLLSGDDDKTARTSAIFRAGATRRLEVTAPRLRGGLTLKWK
jgi:transposase-like protein